VTVTVDRHGLDCVRGRQESCIHGSQETRNLKGRHACHCHVLVPNREAFTGLAYLPSCTAIGLPNTACHHQHHLSPPTSSVAANIVCPCEHLLSPRTSSVPANIACCPQHRPALCTALVLHCTCPVLSIVLAPSTYPGCPRNAVVYKRYPPNPHQKATLFGY
jgi:hypothetical protein